MLSLKTKSQDIAYVTRREFGYPVSDLAGLCNLCGRSRGIPLGGIGRALFGGRLLGQICE